MFNLGDLLMELEKRQRLEAAGWSIGTAADFLELSQEEAAFVELKLALSKFLKEQRKEHKLSQTALARQINSSQSRVAKMEAGDPSVSTDLLIRALLSTGATPVDIAQAIAPVDFASSSTIAQDKEQNDDFYPK